MSARWWVWVVAVALTGPAARGEAKLLHIFDDPNGSGGDGLASAVQSVVLASGNVVAGAPLATAGGDDAAGLVYVFDTGGRLLRTLQSPNPFPNGRFGTAIVVAGADLLVGAPGDTVNGTAAGEVYRFDRGTFALVDTYRPPQLQTGLGFGLTLAVDGGTLYVAAATSSFPTVSGAGAVFALDLATGASLRSFQAPTPSQNAGFGQAIVANGSTLVVGAPGASAGGTAGAGLVHFLDASTTIVLKSVGSSNPTAGGAFGAALALTDSALLVGAPGDADLGEAATGVVYVVDPGTRVIRRSVGLLGAPAGVGFGRAITPGTGSIFVPAAGASADGRNAAGEIHQLDATTLATQRVLSSPDPGAGAHFGAVLATDGTSLVVGEPTSLGGAARLYLFDAASASGSPGGGQGGNGTTSTTTTLPGGCTVAPSFPSAQCELDALGMTLTAATLGPPLGDRLSSILARVQAHVGQAQAATGPRRLRKGLHAAIADLRTFRRRLQAAAGRVAFATGSVLDRLAGGAEEALLEVLATS